MWRAGFIEPRRTWELTRCVRRLAGADSSKPQVRMPGRTNPQKMDLSEWRGLNESAGFAQFWRKSNRHRRNCYYCALQEIAIKNCRQLWRLNLDRSARFWFAQRQ